MALISSFQNDERNGIPRGRVGLFGCECGCGQRFFAMYRTRHPKYSSKTHRARAYRARARARAYADRACYNNDCGRLDYWEEYYSAELFSQLRANRGRM